MESTESKIKGGLNSKGTNEEQNLINERLENSLSLRKRKINEILSKKRGFDKYKKEGKKEYQLEKEEINIPYEIKNKKYEDFEHFLKEMKKFIQLENIEYNKYALYCLRIHQLNNEGTNNKNIYSELLVKQNFIYDILNLIQKYINNKIIVHEGLWILINILYFQTDNFDLVIFLTSKECIQLYIKILDIKDNYLRLNLYWLLTDLFYSNNYGLTCQILFHLYMSPLFRLYIIKDLEDSNSQLEEDETKNLIYILGLLADFINETSINLKKNNIKNFKDYNSEVDFNSIKENNNYLYEHCFLIFLKYIEIQNYTSYCLLGLSKLTNLIENSDLYNKFYKSGLCSKIVKGQIKIEEDFLNYAVQIIGNYIYITPESLLEPIFLEETMNYYVKLIQAYPSRQLLKRDIFWSASNFNILPISGQLLVSSGLLVLALQSIYSDNDIVINEALYMLLGFFYIKNVEIIINNYHLDYIKNLVLCLKNIHNKCKAGEAYKNQDIVERVLVCIDSLFQTGNILKNEGMENKFLKDFEKNGGFELLELMLSEKNISDKATKIAENLLNYQNDN